MDLSYSADDMAFRATVRAFFAEHLTPRLRRAGELLTSVYADPEVAREWQGILHRQGWAAPAWPKAYGGCDWTRVQYMIFSEERARAAAPPLSPMGVGMIGPTLIHHGTDEQKAFFLPKTLSGEIFWCQGYSEPDAGSDLASLRMRADDAGEDFICNGTKTWSTYAHAANWIFCLVRTGSSERPQQGITFLLIDMASPGVEVRPIISLTGEHIQNAIYFTDVRVPKKNVVGAVGAGWSIAKHLLEFERGGEVGAPMLRKLLADTIATANAAHNGMGGSVANDAFIRNEARACANRSRCVRDVGAAVVARRDVRAKRSLHDQSAVHRTQPTHNRAHARSRGPVCTPLSTACGLPRRTCASSSRTERWFRRGRCMASDRAAQVLQ